MPGTEKLASGDSRVPRAVGTPAVDRVFRVEALRAVAQRIAVQTDELAHTIVRRVRTGVVNPGLIEGEPEFDAVVRFASANIEALLSGLTGGEPVPESLLQDARQMGRQLVTNGVSLSAMHHAGRVWGAAMWEAVLAASSADDPEEREAALEIGTRIWHHVDVISTTAALAYLDEVNDRGLVGRELMDTLLGGRGDTEFATRLAHSLHLRLGEQHVVVLVRGDDVPIEDASERPLATRVALDYIVEAVRNHLHPTAGSLLVGIRLGDVVAIYPVSEQDDLRLVRRDCEALARALSIDVSLGMSGWHAGLAEIEVAYAEAREAVEIAAGTGIRGRAVALEEVIVDHMLRSSPHAQRILDAALRPLFEYDRLHHAELVETLRAYLAADTNLTKTARLVTVHPNTIVYRLRRIQELTGRDPRLTEELLVLSLALKLMELRSPSYASDGGEAPTAETGS